ncbi:MAG: hypothetical protein QM687_17350 [Ferruginibacter sp.]
MKNVVAIISKFFKNLFKKRELQHPEDKYIVTITEKFVKVEHPEIEPASIFWEDIEEIKLINTDAGPWLPDIWLALMGEKEDCLIPHGSKGFDEVYDIVSKYEGFNFENVGHSMTCTDNKVFELWKKSN